MLRTMAALVGSVALGCVSAGSLGGANAEHASPMGFALTLSPGWAPIDPDLSEYTLLTDPRYSQIDPMLIRRMLTNIASGNLEFLIRPTERLTENITIRENAIQLPSNLWALLRLCDAIPSQLESQLGRRLEVDRCEIRSVADRHASYIETEGFIEGTLTLQYQIQRTSDRALALTATVLEDSTTDTRHEFDAMVRSIRWIDPR